MWLNSTCMAAVAGAIVLGTLGTARADAVKNSPFLSGPDSFTLKSFLESDAPLSMYGITIYGTIDVGLSNQTHGTNYSPDFPTAVGEVLQKNGAGSTWFATPSGMEQSKAGIKGDIPVIEDMVNAVFKLETAFNPLNGTLANAQKAVVNNYARSNNNLIGTAVAGDSSRSGQIFQGGAFGGLSNPTFGTLTVGRHTTPLFDLVSKYDPLDNAYGFSPIGWSGTYASGLGDTEDARLDDSIKYNVKYGPVRFTGLYQWLGSENTTGGDDAIQANVGIDQGPLSVDAYVGRKRDAINVGITSIGRSNSVLLNPTISDNVGFGGMAKYDLQPYKFMVGYSHVTYMNPGNPLGAANRATSSLAGYDYGTYTNTAYTTASITHMLWFGTKYAVDQDLTLSWAYYLYLKDNYSGIDNGVCIAKLQTTCAARTQFFSMDADYRLNKRFDIYGGFMYEKVDDGAYVNTGFLHNNNLSTATGLRFKF